MKAAQLAAREKLRKLELEEAQKDAKEVRAPRLLPRERGRARIAPPSRALRPRRPTVVPLSSH